MISRRLLALVLILLVVGAVVAVLVFVPINRYVESDQSYLGTPDTGFTNGPWWGWHMTKIATYGDKVFTYTIENTDTGRWTHFYEKTVGGNWAEGISTMSARPETILVDSDGYVHIIGFKSFTPENEYHGQLFHIKMNNSGTVTGPFTKEYISPPQDQYGSDPLEFVTIYFGAGIGPDGTIVVVSTNSESEPWGLVARIYNCTSKTWHIEPITLDLPSRFCYQYVQVTSKAIHVVAIEDQYDPELEDEWFQYRFGMVKYFRKELPSGTWHEETLIDLNPTYSAVDILNLGLKVDELGVDSGGNVNVIFHHRVNVDTDEFNVYHLTRPELGDEWTNTTWVSTSTWTRLWENENGDQYYVCAEWGNDLSVIPVGTDTRYYITRLPSEYTDDLWVYIPETRGGSTLSDYLEVVAYEAYPESGTEAVTVEVDMSSFSWSWGFQP